MLPWILPRVTITVKILLDNENIFDYSRANE